MRVLLLILLAIPCAAKDRLTEADFPLTFKVLASDSAPSRSAPTGSTSRTSCTDVLHGIDCDTTTEPDASPFTTWNVIVVGVLTEDGKTTKYTLGCSATFRWERCSGLLPGDFHARWNNGKLEVRYRTGSKWRSYRYPILRAEVQE